MQCYAKDSRNGIGLVSGRPYVEAAKRYGFVAVGLSTPEGNWNFGADGVANSSNPQPCSEEESTDIPYVKVRTTMLCALQAATCRTNVPLHVRFLCMCLLLFHATRRTSCS
eukprot:195799-Pyramimonas_sp.AAC.1